MKRKDWFMNTEEELKTLIDYWKEFKKLTEKLKYMQILQNIYNMDLLEAIRLAKKKYKYDLEIENKRKPPYEVIPKDVYEMWKKEWINMEIYTYPDKI